MGREGVDLGDPGHGGGKGRTDRTPGPEDVTVLHDLLADEVGDVIGDGVTVGDDPVQFLFQTIDNQGIGIGSVGLVEVFIAEGPELLGRTRKIAIGGIELGLEDLDRLAEVGDLEGVIDHHFPGFLLGEPFPEAIEHFLGGP